LSDKQIIEQKYCNDLRLFHKTSSGEEVYRCENSIVVMLPQKRNAITTSYVNGGYQEDLQAVFNHEPDPTRGHCGHDLEGGSVEAYIRIHAERLGLNPDRVAAMMTAAKMKNAAISVRSFRSLEVTAIVTAGIEVNGGRAGDPASWHEEEGKTVYVGGTINTIILVNSHLPAHTLARVIMTATEAKTVAIQELMAPSRYSSGIATGSGTDQISVISNMDSPDIITWAGKHSKLGELVATAVIDATKQALFLQTNLCADTQRDMMVRLGRYGITEEQFWTCASSLPGENKKDLFIRNLRDFSRDSAVVTMTASLLHIQDEISWGLVPERIGTMTACEMMKTLPVITQAGQNPDFSALIDDRVKILENWVRLVSWCVKNVPGDSV